VMLPASAPMKDALEAFLKSKGYQHFDDNITFVHMWSHIDCVLCAHDGQLLDISIADLELKPDSEVKVLFYLV